VDSVLRRRRWIVRRKLEGWRSIDVATALRIDERTVYRWWRLYRKYGWEGLALKSRAPHNHYETPQVTVNFILQLKREKHWGPNKIEGYLRNYRPQGITPASHRTIHHWRAILDGTPRSDLYQFPEVRVLFPCILTSFGNIWDGIGSPSVD